LLKHIESIDEKYMREALKEAQQALNEGEIPVGAVVVCNGKILARAHNLTQRLNDPTAHAEMQAITSATYAIGGKYLTGCTLYVTLEPCVMCAGALFWAQIERIVYGASDPKRGYRLVESSLLHPKTIVESGVLEKECAALLIDFFKKKR
jgi:tRNA(adenine34) deaminase